jgi:hypothetical protein
MEQKNEVDNFYSTSPQNNQMPRVQNFIDSTVKETKRPVTTQDFHKKMYRRSSTWQVKTQEPNSFAVVKVSRHLKH